MPMDKISTRTTFSSQKPSADVVTPSPMSLEKIRQFARAYAYSKVIGKLGGMILN